MKELLKLTTESKKTIVSLAAEFKFAQELKELLTKLETDSVHVDEKIREANKMLHVYKWIARAEKKTARREKSIEKLLSELGMLLVGKRALSLPQMKIQLSIADKNLEKLASLYTGKMRIELDEIEEAEKLLRSLENSGKGKVRANAVHVRLEAEMKDLQKSLEELIHWIETNTVLIKIIEKWAREFQQEETH